MDEIKNFNALKSVVEDMQKNADKLGIDGVFASTSLKTGEDWRWQTHLLNVPLYYELRGSEDYNDPTIAGLNAKEIAFARCCPSRRKYSASSCVLDVRC